MFRTCSLLLAASGIAFVLTADATIADESDSTLHQPIASADLVFAEIDGLVAVEAEHYFRQEKSNVRAWFRTTSKEQPEIDPDGDPPHVGGASGGAYLESLPDTRRTHADKLISSQNFSNEPGKLAILNYKVHFQNGGSHQLDLTKATGKFSIEWFNPRGGGPLSKGAVKRVSGGTQAELGEPSSDTHQDWLAIIRNAD